MHSWPVAQHSQGMTTANGLLRHVRGHLLEGGSRGLEGRRCTAAHDPALTAGPRRPRRRAVSQPSQRSAHHVLARPARGGNAQVSMGPDTHACSATTYSCALHRAEGGDAQTIIPRLGSVHAATALTQCLPASPQVCIM